MVALLDNTNQYFLKRNIIVLFPGVFEFLGAEGSEGLDDALAG